MSELAPSHGKPPSMAPGIPLDLPARGEGREMDTELTGGASEQPDMPLPSDLPTIFLSGIFILMALVLLKVANAVVLPIVLAFVLKLLLQPPFRLLQQIYIPRPIAAVVVIALALGSVTGLITVFSGPAATWIAKLPDGIPRLQEHLSILGTPIAALQHLLQKAEHITGQAPGPSSTGFG